MQVIQDRRHRRVLGRQRRRKLQQEHMIARPAPHSCRQRPRQDNAGLAQRRHDARPEAPGRLSNSSRPTQATTPGSATAHNARAVVLPAPAGPLTTVSWHHRTPSAMSLVTRGHRTARSGTPGAVIFAAGTGSSADTADRLVRGATWLAPWVAIDTLPGPFFPGQRPDSRGPLAITCMGCRSACHSRPHGRRLPS